MDNTVILEAMDLRKSYGDLEIIKGLDFSPVKGPEGNIEYLIYLEKGRGGTPCAPDIAGVVEASHTHLNGGDRH